MATPRHLYDVVIPTVGRRSLATLVGTLRRRLPAEVAIVVDDDRWWGWRTSRFAWHRIAPGPRRAREIAAMVTTSIAIPPTACYHRLRAHLALAE